MITTTNESSAINVRADAPQGACNGTNRCTKAPPLRSHSFTPLAQIHNYLVPRYSTCTELNLGLSIYLVPPLKPGGVGRNDGNGTRHNAMSLPGRLGPF